ncbi:MAG: trehalose-6-phosphate synthase, partial [Burkholderiales bacterium]
DAVVAEARGPNPIILVQDYHFALLPQMLRDRLPDATIAIFWHIPWPNAEAFGVCPWRVEVLKGMLAADIVGFHTRAHCRNFLETVDRFVESHIDHENGTVVTKDHECSVEPYPISIEWPPRWLEHTPSVADCRKRVMAEFGLRSDVRITLGVERWDFTKGIVDRMLALERLLDTEPHWRGRVVLLQIAAPSRGKLPAYQELQRATLEAAERINKKYSVGDGAGSYQPIILITEHRSPAKVFELFRACDVCIVNSLHDGMNLVAKEFVAARSDEDGVLVLSTFAGASRELLEAVLVNPFDVDDTANALRRALTMQADERSTRMRIMRSTVKENNVYRWAGRMMMDAARIRQRQRLKLLESGQAKTRPNTERRPLSRVV